MIQWDDSAEICYNCTRQVWIVALTVADIISDFLYFEELYSEAKVMHVIVVFFLAATKL